MGQWLQIGDTASIQVNPENRAWGYNPAPDGTLVEIIGFGEQHVPRINNYGQAPGVYQNKYWVDVKLPDASVVRISALHLQSLDEKLKEQRLQQWRDAGMPDNEKLRDLPETAFYEMDQVLIARQPASPDLDGPREIVSIDYGWMEAKRNAKRNDGSPYPFYRVTAYATNSKGATTGACEHEMTLLARGPVWCWYHNEPVIFASLQEEADFHYQMGFVEEVRNPKTDLFSWTLEETLTAIKDGLADGFSVSRGLFGSNDLNHSLIKYKHEDVGKRVRAATLEGFKERIG